MDWIVEEIPKLKGFQVEWAGRDGYYLSRRDQIFRLLNIDAELERICTIPTPLLRRTAARFRPFQRLLRFLVTNVIPLDNGELFVTFDKTVGVIRNGKFITLNGLMRPCRVLRSACAVDRSGKVYFGEYLLNESRGEMRIYSHSPGSDSLEVVHTFPANSIRHIHGIYLDAFTDSLFCLTGDVDSECRILQTFDGFKTFKVIGEGDESWRAVSVLFKADSMLYGTDAEHRTNNIFRIDRATGKRTSLGDVNGTVFYSKQAGSELFFATTAENAPSQTENVAAIYRVDEDGISEVAKFQKDLWPPSLFLFGLIHFPNSNTPADELFFHLVGLKGDNRTFRLRREC